MSFLRKIRRLFQNKSVMDASALSEQLSGRSRRSVFRDLSKIKYLASFTHSGRYFTLPSIPQFDSHGLWFVGKIGFSRYGTLKEALRRIIQEADAGHTHDELEKMFHVRSLHNTLLNLVESKRITRKIFGDSNVYLYLSCDRERAYRQQQRRQHFHKREEIAKSIPPLFVVRVLVEVIRNCRVQVSASEVWQCLRQRGVRATLEQVEYVFARYSIGVKKTHSSR